jgi:hypothetical protein
MKMSIGAAICSISVIDILARRMRGVTNRTYLRRRLLFSGPAAIQVDGLTGNIIGGRGG